MSARARTDRDRFGYGWELFEVELSGSRIDIVLRRGAIKRRLSMPRDLLQAIISETKRKAGWMKVEAERWMAAANAVEK